MAKHFAAYSVTAATEFKEGDPSGPRILFGVREDVGKYFGIGSYAASNNIDTRDRPLKIVGTGLGEAPHGITLSSLLIDPKTGQLYYGH